MKYSSFFRLVVCMCVVAVFGGLFGCANSPGFSHPPAESTSTPASLVAAQRDSASTSALPLVEPTLPPHFHNSYIHDVAADINAQILTPAMSDQQKILTAYDYLVAHTYFLLPLGLDDWRYQGGEGQPGVFELMGYSPLAYGTGYCEEYAAAMMLLLWDMGFETRYVTGLTPSVDGRWVDHAWLMVKLEGEWYHLDPQLEDNVTQNGRLIYRYFLRTDNYMAQDHRWGERLVAPDGHLYAHDRSDPLEPNQWMDALAASGIDASAPYPACSAEIPRQSARTISKALRPDVNAIANRIDGEQAALAAQNGKDNTILPFVLPYAGRIG